MTKLIFITLTILISEFIFAGAISGGGGQGIVCRDVKGNITSAQSMDLYEGRIVYGLHISTNATPFQTQAKLAVSTIVSPVGRLIEYYSEQIQKYMRIMPVGVQLQPINDSLDVIIPPKGCAIEQLANYYNDKNILISGDIWNALSETDRAALILHEAVYATNRIVGATDSRQSRHVVASLFDPSTKWTNVKDQLPTDALNCISSAGGLYMWAFKTQEGWTLQFQILANAYVMSKKIFQTHSPKFNFTEAKSFPILKGDDKVGTSISEGGAARSIFEDEDTIVITRTWEHIVDQNGRMIEGYQTPRYYLSWVSQTYPKSSIEKIPLNCGLEVPRFEK
ncbi:MAG: hypothetical protein KDD45_00480 [Bdellovibrionales bacterium]|nr:hypothetical protein [Bdellovibrionales bacterium]